MERVKNNCKIRFPYAALNPRHGLTLSQRLGLIAEWRIKRREIPLLPIKPHAPFQLVTMAGFNQIYLMRETLYSFLRNASLMPKIIVISDGSLISSEIRDILSFWPSEVEVIMPSDIISFISPKIRVLVEPLIKAHPLGIKLAGVIALSQKGPLFFTDSDILWFADPIPTLVNCFTDFKIAVTTELGCSINKTLAKKYAPCLLNSPSANSGCIITNYDMSTDLLLTELLIEASNDLKNRFNEQTIFGILSQIRSGGFLPSKLCLVEFDDAFCYKYRNPTQENYISRHYVSYMRHQFYRDALKYQY